MRLDITKPKSLFHRAICHVKPLKDPALPIRYDSVHEWCMVLDREPPVFFKTLNLWSIMRVDFTKPKIMFHADQIWLGGSRIMFSLLEHWGKWGCVLSQSWRRSTSRSTCSNVVFRRSQTHRFSSSVVSSNILLELLHNHNKLRCIRQ